jgi:hypothetical protein
MSFALCFSPFASNQQQETKSELTPGKPETLFLAYT